MTDLPDSFFKDREQNKSVPGATTEQTAPWDNSQHDLDKYLNKANPPVDASELTANRKLPKGAKIREALYYSYRIGKPPESVGTSGDCSLFAVKVTCVVIVRAYWVRIGQTDLLVDEYEFATQWVLRKLIMICPAGAISDLGVLDLLKGDPELRPDSKIDLSEGGVAGQPPPNVYRPPTSLLDDPHAQLHVNEGGVDYLELWSNDWQFVRQQSKGCTIKATYRKRLRKLRKTLPNGPTRERYEEVQPVDERTFSFEIPGCNNGVYTDPNPGKWSPPKALFEPTQGTSVSEGGDNYLVYRDLAWLKVEVPPAEVKDCYLTVTYQAYTQYQKVRSPQDPTRQDPAPVLTPVDPQQFRKFSFRIPGCLEALFTAISSEYGKQEMRYQELRCALEGAREDITDSFDLNRTRSLLAVELGRIERMLVDLTAAQRGSALEALRPEFDLKIDKIGSEMGRPKPE